MAIKENNLQAQKDDSPVNRRKPLADRVDELRGRLAGKDVQLLTIRSGGQYMKNAAEAAEIRLKLWDDEVYLTAPDFIARKMPGKVELDLASQGLVLYYLVTADGALPDESWISFSDLPDGRFYAQAFQGYTGKELGKYFKDNLPDFEGAASRAGGSAYPLGDAAYTFEVFPRVSLLVIAWRGDEDFPSTYQVLFSGSSPHYLPTDACAIAGSMLTRKIIAAAARITDE